MKSILAILALSLTANAQALGFAPWEDRDISPTESVIAAGVAEPSTPAPGFAPWRIIQRDSKFVVEPELRMTGNMGTIFRPWS